MNHHRNEAMTGAEAIFAALGNAQARATAAMTRGEIRYCPRLGFARRNLFECWLMYAWCTRQRRPELPAFRRQLRRQIGIYRQLREHGLLTGFLCSLVIAICAASLSGCGEESVAVTRLGIVLPR